MSTPPVVFAVIQQAWQGDGTCVEIFASYESASKWIDKEKKKPYPPDYGIEEFEVKP